MHERLSGAREVVMTFMMDVIEEVLKIFHVSRILGSKSVLFTSASQPSRERKRERKTKAACGQSTHQSVETRTCRHRKHKGEMAAE